MARKNDDQNTVRRYLLRQLSDAEQQAVELRLLGDDELSEELDIVEDELIDEYLNDELSKDERMRFEGDFLASPERKRKLASGEALRRYIANVTPGPAPIPEQVTKTGKLDRLLNWLRQFFSSPPIAVAAALLLVAVLGIAVWRGIFYQSDVDKGLIALNGAYSQERPVEARITSLHYAPFVVTRGPQSKVKVDETKRQLAELTLLSALDRKPSPAVHHALGKVYLAKNDFDRAIEQFEEALKGDPGNAQIHADLGAAYLEKGKIEIEKGQADQNNLESGKGLESLARSLENLNKALEVTPELLEARFNRALVYQNMRLFQQAVEEWKKYLEKDPNSPWAEEARRNLKLLEDQRTKSSQTTEQSFGDFARAYEVNDDEAAWKAIRQSRTRTGNRIVETLLDEFLGLSTQGQNRAAEEKLLTLSYAARLEEQESGDRFTTDLANFYRNVPPAQRQLLIEARGEQKKALERYNLSDFEKAVEYYAKARDLFSEAGDETEALFAECWMGYSYLRIPNASKSLEIFDRLSAIFSTRRYNSLLAQTLISISDAWTSRNELSKALDYANRCVTVGEKIGDEGAVVRGMSQFVSAQLGLGNYRESIGTVLAALTLADLVAPDPKIKWPFYHEAALSFFMLGFPASAVAFEEEAARLASASGMVLLKSRSWERLGLIYEQSRSFEEAIKYGELALEESKHLSGLSQTNIMAHSNLNLGQMYRKSGDLPKAIHYYDEAMNLYGKLGLDIYLYQAHKGRLQAMIGLKDDNAAAQELATVLDLFEQNRARISEESNRNRFFDLDQNAYDLAIDFSYFRRNQTDEALGYAEASRARSLNEMISEGARVSEDRGRPEIRLGDKSKPLTPIQIRERLPKQAQLLEYAVLEDKLLIWVVTKTAINTATVSVGAADLERMTQAFVRDLSQGADHDTVSRAGRELHAALIAPIEQYLDSKLVLGVVADKSLNYLPFEALISPLSGHYLIEDYRLERAPSATIFIQSSEEATAREQVVNERLLSVGNPAFDRAKFESLPDLPAAKREAEEIATLYRPATSLIGHSATLTRVRSALGSADVIHFATHAVIDERFPLLSSLLLARDPSENAHANNAGVLRAADIYATKLPRARLVVLSACQTGIEQSYRGEGAIGLARPFIAARVPLVVASLWPVESNTTADLMISFHKYRKIKRMPTVDALRQAQLDSIHGQKNPSNSYGWAAFTTIGGYAAF